MQGVLSAGSNVGDGSVLAREAALSNTITLEYGGNTFNTGLVYSTSLDVTVEIN